MMGISDEIRIDDPPEVALEKLFRSHGDHVYGLGVKMCGNAEDAEDLVQETFMAAYRAWDSFQGDSQPSTWLYRIAVRTCHRFHRRRSGQPAGMMSLEQLLPSGDDAVVDIVDTRDGPLDETIHHEAEEAVRDGLAGLPIAYRIPLTLKELSGLSVAEIADVTGLKTSTVRTRIHRGRLLLASEITARLRTRKGGRLAHARQTCISLLKQKMEALDRGEDFRPPEGELCDRCRSLFWTLDLGQQTCRDIARGRRVPEALRRRLRRAIRDS